MRSIAIGVLLLASLGMEAQQMNAGSDVVTPTTGTLFTCESINNIKHTCRVDARNRMVAVNQQLSENTCVYGRSWGVNRDRRSVWVDRGCRAEFIIGNAAVARSSFASRVTCQSHNNGRATCPADTSYGVQVMRQLSKNGCERGRDWGFDQNGIWVNNGCRAEFILGSGMDVVPMTSSARTSVTCESAKTDVRKHCMTPGTFNGVALARQISRSACVRGETWGYDSDGVWVARGCRAEFVVGQ